MANSKYSRIIANATTVCVIVLGVLFMICCAHLYFTGGEQPYSRESVGKYLIILAVPSFITLAIAICGVIYNAITGERDERDTARTSGELLQSFTKRFQLKDFPDGVKAEAMKEEDKRVNYAWIAGDISLFLCLTALVYFDLFTKFTVENLNGDVLMALAGILPLTVCAVAVHIPKVYLMEKSCERELAILKASVRENGAPRVAEKKAVRPRAQIARYVILGMAVLLVIIGIFNGGMADVLAKAVKICTECIGLG